MPYREPPGGDGKKTMGPGTNRHGSVSFAASHPSAFVGGGGGGLLVIKRVRLAKTGREFAFSGDLEMLAIYESHTTRRLSAVVVAAREQGQSKQEVIRGR
jgi:hypothetical protein